MEIGTYRSNSTETEWWVGFEKFPLFEHSEKKDKKSGGKRRNTKKTPWLMIALTVSWMMFCLVGMITINATHLEENSPHPKDRKVKSGQMEWPVEKLQNEHDTWRGREMVQPDDHLDRNQYSHSATGKGSKIISVERSMTTHLTWKTNPAWRLE